MHCEISPWSLQVHCVFLLQINSQEDEEEEDND
jgi:hypothetical protein